MSVLRVVLADDQSMIRSGLRALLDAEPDIQVVAEVGDGAAALAAVRTHRPDVVVMDIRMPVMDGIAATRAIAADPQLSATRVLVLTTYDEDALVFEAIRAGAAGFLLKDAEPAELLRGVRITATGDALLAPAAARRLIGAFAAAPPPSGPPSHQLDLLTEREQQVVTLAGRGLSNDPLSNSLHMLAFVLASYLLPIGAAGLAYLAYRRTPWAATIGGLLAVVGWLPFSALTALDDLINAAASRTDAAVLGGLLHQFATDPVMMAYLLVYIVCHLVAYVVLGQALRHVIPSWAGWAMVASSPLTVLAFALPGSPRLMGAIALSLLVAGCIPAAGAILRPPAVTAGRPQTSTRSEALPLN